MSPRHESTQSVLIHWFQDLYTYKINHTQIIKGKEAILRQKEKLDVVLLYWNAMTPGLSTR